MAGNKTYEMLHSYFPRVAVSKADDIKEDLIDKSKQMELSVEIAELNRTRKTFTDKDGVNYIT